MYRKAYKQLKQEYFSYQASILRLSSAIASTNANNSYRSNYPPPQPQAQTQNSFPKPQRQTQQQVKPAPSLPPQPLTISQALSQQITGAFPKNCVLWIRHLNPTITKKSTLKSIFQNLLEKLEEGTGKLGVEFVDWDKGLDTVRFNPYVFLFLNVKTNNPPTLRNSVTSDSVLRT